MTWLRDYINGVTFQRAALGALPRWEGSQGAYRSEADYLAFKEWERNLPGFPKPRIRVKAISRPVASTTNDEGAV